MALSAHRSSGDPSLEPEPASYASNVLRLFVEGLKQEAEVLDVGPVCNENIGFFAHRVRRLSVCDMFLRVDRVRRRDLPPSEVLRHLDYPPQSFDGILLWDLVDRLDEREAAGLAELCDTMLKPGGMVMLLVLGEEGIPVVNSFVIGEDFRLYPRAQPHLDLPLHIRQNREVLALLAPLTPLKSFIYRNRIREFLFQRD